MIPTPDLSHLTTADYDKVYEPAEDTFLLLDALEKDADVLRAAKPSVVLEVGSGSGCVTAFLSQILGPTNTLYLSTDINSHACKCTRSTGNRNSVTIESVNTSFAGPLASRLKNKIDIVIFNPPYVPTGSPESSEAQFARNIAGAWAGGTSGMEVTDVFLDVVPDLVSPHGVFYLVALKENGIPAIQKRMTEKHMDSQIAMQRRAGKEHLFILKFIQTQQ
ncbi:putative methylase [Fistulina hepatica ATCC 64428]|uniref:Putative methylase n=1 Tax=Fistulina hepatica ATCC 64428 TaxID=1128425 RepID=A0A0D7ARL5_9AGAR|nr:putative methylase [Fistulina hepatica ATCC 64428]